MLGQDDLLAWFQRLGTPDATRSIINHIRSSGPSRRVAGGRSNVSGRYPSRKMGATIQFESHRVELAGIYEMEHDPNVLEYFDQPPAIKLDYASAAGKRMGVLHTPDFFVVRQQEAGWEEWKTEENWIDSTRITLIATLWGKMGNGIVRLAKPMQSHCDSTIGFVVRARLIGRTSAIYSFSRTISEVIHRRYKPEAKSL